MKNNKMILFIMSIIAISSSISGLNGMCISDSDRELAQKIFTEKEKYDFNCDGKIDVVDSFYVLNHYVCLSIHNELSNSFTMYINYSDEKEFDTVKEYLIDNYSYTLENDNTRYKFTFPISEISKQKLEDYSDIDGDGYVDSSDAFWMTRAYYLQFENGDVNNDNKIDASDASDILVYYANKSTVNNSDLYKEIQMDCLGDMNYDGRVDASDASDILAEYAKRATN